MTYISCCIKWKVFCFTYKKYVTYLNKYFSHLNKYFSHLNKCFCHLNKYFSHLNTLQSEHMSNFLLHSALLTQTCPRILYVLLVNFVW